MSIITFTYTSTRKKLTKNKQAIYISISQLKQCSIKSGTKPFLICTLSRSTKSKCRNQGRVNPLPHEKKTQPIIHFAPIKSLAICKIVWGNHWTLTKYVASHGHITRFGLCAEYTRQNPLTAKTNFTVFRLRYIIKEQFL